ncbi:MAG: dockerin type I domain-containing protein, partial [Planctomycetota bacterium]
GIDTFQFNGADGADDELRLTLATDGGAAGDGTHPDADFDLTRVAPSAFTIENGQIERATIHGLGGNDRLDVSTLPQDVVDVAFAGGTGDDSLILNDLIDKTADGGEGLDQILARGANATIDFAAAADQAIQAIEVIRLDPALPNSVRVDPEAIVRVIGSDADLTVRGDSDDTIDIGEGWQHNAPETIDGQFHQSFSAGDLLLKVASGRPFQNVLQPTDVNADGKVSPLDALLVINAIIRARSPEVEKGDERPTDVSSFLFEDVSGNGAVSALDALLVINRLSRQRQELESDPESESQLLTAPNIRSSTVDDNLSDDGESRSLF